MNDKAKLHFIRKRSRLDSLVEEFPSSLSIPCQSYQYHPLSLTVSTSHTYDLSPKNPQDPPRHFVRSGASLLTPCLLTYVRFSMRGMNERTGLENKQNRSLLAIVIFPAGAGVTGAINSHLFSSSRPPPPSSLFDSGVEPCTTERRRAIGW